MKIFPPSRSIRRRVAGSPCAACGALLHYRDLYAAQDDDGTLFLHSSCVRLLAEMAAAHPEEETGGPAAEAEQSSNTSEAILTQAEAQ